jgi:hypothetical protein
LSQRGIVEHMTEEVLRDEKTRRDYGGVEFKGATVKTYRKTYFRIMRNSKKGGFYLQPSDLVHNEPGLVSVAQHGCNLNLANNGGSNGSKNDLLKQERQTLHPG